MTGTPCAGVKLPKGKVRRVEPLSVDEVQALTNALPDRYRALVTLAAGTGLRQGARSASLGRTRLGHATAGETLDTYSHFWPDDEDRTRAAVDDVLGARVSLACHEAGELS